MQAVSSVSVLKLSALVRASLVRHRRGHAICLLVCLRLLAGPEKSEDPIRGDLEVLGVIATVIAVINAERVYISRSLCHEYWLVLQDCELPDAVAELRVQH